MHKIYSYNFPKINRRLTYFLRLYIQGVLKNNQERSTGRLGEQF